MVSWQKFQQRGLATLVNKNAVFLARDLGKMVNRVESAERRPPVPRGTVPLAMTRTAVAWSMYF